MLISLFNELLEEHPYYREYIPEVSEDVVKAVIAQLNMRVRSQLIVDFVVGRYEKVLNG